MTDKPIHLPSATHPITVEIEPRYLSEQSSPEEDVYTFSYAVTVTNNSQVATQLNGDAQGSSDQAKVRLLIAVVNDLGK
jgi:uncharacterized protein affecting Mg2+/Co2+ transport